MPQPHEQKLHEVVNLADFRELQVFRRGPNRGYVEESVERQAGSRRQ